MTRPASSAGKKQNLREKKLPVSVPALFGQSQICCAKQSNSTSMLSTLQHK